MAEQSTSLQDKMVWYASYGSNVAYEKRFLCYIKGGTPLGSKAKNSGCRDTTAPLHIRPITLDFELFFAGYFKRWGGAAAFIRHGEINAKVLGRMYLITDEQFNDVVLQENGREVDGARLVPPAEQLYDAKEYVLPGLKTYGRLLLVGIADSYPILTFTATESHAPPIAPPSEPYVKVMARGLKETYPGMNDREIVEYLLRAEGVRDRIQPDHLASWVAKSSSEF
jgi:hypothetical protein